MAIHCILRPFLAGLRLSYPVAAAGTDSPAPVPSIFSGSSGGLAGPPWTGSQPNITQQILRHRLLQFLYLNLLEPFVRRPLKE